MVAEAYGQKLFEDEINPYLSKINTASDSQFVQSKVVDDWLMDKIIYQEAKSRIKNNDKINKLVEDYRQSLIINEWEKLIIQSNLDTFIDQSEIDSFFTYHKEDFLLEESILRFLFVKSPADSINEDFDDIWKTEDIPALKQFCTETNSFCQLDPSEWYKISSLKNIIPSELFAKVSLKKPNNYTLKQNDTQFYLRIVDIVDDTKDIPVEFVSERIKLRIIQDRIKGLLKKKKSELFDQKIKSKEITIYGKTQ